MDEYYAWASARLAEAGTLYEPVTCDLCLGEVVANVVDRPHAGESVWHLALRDLSDRLATFEIVRVRARLSGCENLVHDIIDIQWKDKVWLTNAIHEGATHIYTTDHLIWENQGQLTRAAMKIGKPAVKIHSPYRRK